jgi:uncharacterized protein (DUF2249 family)
MSPRDPRRIAERHQRPAEPTAPRPAALGGLRRVDCDVRADIARGQEPFAEIMRAVRALAPDQALVLRAPFEPVPLYDVLGRRGFDHWTEHASAGDCSIWFYRHAGATAPASEPAAPTTPSSTIDVRGLEPPLPMVTVLERLETLAPGGVLVVLHDRRPMFLYPQLDARGFLHETDEPEPGAVRIVIRRPPA